MKKTWGVGKATQEALDNIAKAGKQETMNEGRDDAHDRHPALSVGLEWENGDGHSIPYGQLLGGIYHNPPRGIQFLYEGGFVRGWGQRRFGVHVVTIEGAELENVFHHLSSAKEYQIKACETRRITVDGPIQLDGYSESGN